MVEVEFSPDNAYWILEVGDYPSGASRAFGLINYGGSLPHGAYAQSALTDTTSKPSSGWWEFQTLILFDISSLPAESTINTVDFRSIVSAIRHQDDESAYLHIAWWSGEDFPPVDDLRDINGSGFGDANSGTNILATDPYTLDALIADLPEHGDSTVNVGYSLDDFDISIDDFSGITPGNCTAGIVISIVTAFPDSLDSDTFSNAGTDPSQRADFQDPRLVVDYTEPAGETPPAEELPLDEQVIPPATAETVEGIVYPQLADELLAVRRYPSPEFAARIRREGLKRRKL